MVHYTNIVDSTEHCLIMHRDCKNVIIKNKRNIKNKEIQTKYEIIFLFWL